jgi:hypothetical protein
MTVRRLISYSTFSGRPTRMPIGDSCQHDRRSRSRRSSKRRSDHDQSRVARHRGDQSRVAAGTPLPEDRCLRSSGVAPRRGAPAARQQPATQFPVVFTTDPARIWPLGLDDVTLSPPSGQRSVSDRDHGPGRMARTGGRDWGDPCKERSASGHQLICRKTSARPRVDTRGVMSCCAK